MAGGTKKAADEFVEEVLEETVEGVEEAATETVKEEAEAAAEEVAEKADETTEDTEDESTEESEDEMSEDDADEASEKTKKGLFKKKKDKRDEQIEELTDQVKRQMAEFDNFRKRTEKEKSMMFDMGAKTIIEKILPVVDNFERGLAAVPEEQKDDPFVDGMDKIYKQMLTELENIGVKPIESVGTEFDPEFHNAVMQVESEEFESGVVAQELQKGYTYKDSVVRHSMVAVVS
ncbi:MAG: nucleotide exchange factor GrpE [Agathobacter sp.]|nr:nucleotide exchange factor GrpE [Agathobacter sp.]